MTVHARLAPSNLIALAIAGVFACTLLSGQALAQGADAEKTDPKFRTAVRRYLEVQGGAQMTGEQLSYSMAEQAAYAIAQSGTEITEQVKEIVLGEALSTFGEKFGNLDTLTDLYTPLYAEIFTEKEILELITFYESPIGKKSLESAVPLSQGAMQALQEASMAITPGYQLRLEEKLKAAGVPVPVPPKP